MLTREQALVELGKQESAFVSGGVMWCFCYVAKEERAVADALGMETRELPLSMLGPEDMTRLIAADQQTKDLWIMTAQLRGQI